MSENFTSQTRPHFKLRGKHLSLAATVALSGLVLAGCSSGDNGKSNEAGNGSEASIVTTTTQLGSIASQITECAGGDVEVLMGPGDDPHQFSISSQQVLAMTKADIVFTNGLGLESSMQTSLDNAQDDGATIYAVAEDLDPLPFGGHDDHHGHDHGHDDGHDDGHDHGHDHGSLDPHVWLDVSRMATAASNMGAQLKEATGNDQYGTCGDEVAEDLKATDEKVKEILSGIEKDDPKILTDHDAYSYFSDAYGIEISGIVVPGGSTDGEPSSQDLVKLNKILKDEKADAMVTSIQNTIPVMEALASESGHSVPLVKIYESGLGAPDSEASTYQDAMIYNAQAIADAINEE